MSTLPIKPKPTHEVEIGESLIVAPGGGVIATIFRSRDDDPITIRSVQHVYDQNTGRAVQREATGGTYEKHLAYWRQYYKGVALKVVPPEPQRVAV